MSKFITLEKYDKEGNVMFVMQKTKLQAKALIDNHSKYPSGEKHWVLVPNEPKKIGRPKKEEDENS